jgi:YVTN family beta-propeller protein
VRSTSLAVLLAAATGIAFGQTNVAAGPNPRSVTVNPVTNKIYIANVNSAFVTVVDGATNATTTVPTGSGPISIGVNPITNKIYVANEGSNSVTVIDGATNSTSTVTVGAMPEWVAVNPATNKIYVANFLGANVTVIDGATNSTSTVATGTNPTAVAVNPVTNKIYVANQGSYNVTVIDGASNSTSTVAAGQAPLAIAVNPVTNKIYVANESSGNVTVIDGATNSTSTVAAGGQPASVAVNPVTNKIYVANSNGNSVTIIDGATNSTSTVTAGNIAISVAVNQVTNKIYVANQGSTYVTVIDGATNVTYTVASGAFGNSPHGVAVNPVTNKIYVINYFNDMTMIDGATNFTSPVVTGASPTSVAVNPVTNKIYVANFAGNNVTVIDGATNSTATVMVGTHPYAMEVNPVTNRIYVVNQNSANVTVIDGATNSTTTVSVGTSPEAVAVNPVTNKIYVANYDSNSVTVIDGATNSTVTVVVGTGPQSLAVNPVTNKVYVGTGGSNNVTVIDGATNSTATVAVGTGAPSVAVNPVTNKIYVANYGSGTVTVIDGATNSTATVAVGIDPNSVAVNPVTNKIYVSNQTSNVTVIDGATNSTIGIAGGSNPERVTVNPVTNKIYISSYTQIYMTVIDGTTNSTTTLLAPYSNAVGVNPVTNKIYVADINLGSVTVITEEQLQPSPLNTTITALPGNQTSNPSPTFTFTASSAIFTTPDTVYYQADTWQRKWSAATPGSGSFSGTVASLQPGFHILYAYAGDSQEATSTQPQSPLIGAIQAYGFLVTPPAPAVTPQSITFGPLPDQVLGVADFGVSATASSGLTVSFASTSASVCTVSGSTVHLLNIGTCSIQATQSGNAAFSGAPAVSQSFNVTSSQSSGVAFVTGFRGGALRNNHTGGVGMQFSVGAQALTVTDLGRVYVFGNSGTHTVKLVSTNGQDVAGGAVTINMSGGTDGQFTYAPLPSPLVLPANTSYYLVSSETIGGDQWHDLSAVTNTLVATIPGAVYSLGNTYTPVPPVGTAYVPLNFHYSVGSATNLPPVVTVTSPSTGATSGTVTFSATASPGLGLTMTSLQLKVDGNNVGTPGTTSVATSLDTTKLTNGTHTLTAAGTDSAGQSTTSNPVSIYVSNTVTPPPAGVSLVVPAANAVLSGTIQAIVSAPSNSQLVQLLVDGSAYTGLGNYGGGSFQSALNTNQLTNGPHQISAAVTDSSGARTTTTPITVTVSNGVTPPPSAPPTVSITAPAPNASVSGTITVSATATANGGATMSNVLFRVGASNIGGAVSGPGPDYSVQLDTTILANGSYTLYAIATDSLNQSTTVAISVTVSNAATPPPGGIALLVPAANATLSGTIQAIVNAPSSSTLVQLLVDGSAFTGMGNYGGGSFQAPLNTNQLTDGAHQISAAVTDLSGVRTATTPITVTVKNGAALPAPPTVGITSPGPNAVVSGMSAVTATAIAHGGATIAQVLFYLGNSLNAIIAGSGPSYVSYLDTAHYPNGTYTLTAIATDSSGQSTTSAPVAIIINNAGAVPPAGVSLLVPAANAVLSGTIQAIVSAPSSSKLVQLFVDGSAFTGMGDYGGGSFRAPLDTNQLSNGTHQIWAAVTDSSGVRSTTTSIMVTVNNGGSAPPAVSLTAPAPNSTISGMITVSATAAANGGATMSNVQFKVGPTNIGAAVTGAGPSYGVPFDTTTLANGSTHLPRWRLTRSVSRPPLASSRLR